FTGFENIQVENVSNTFASLTLGSQPIEVDATGYLQVFVYSFFNYTASAVIYTLSLHDALPIFYNNGNSPVSYDLTANTFSHVNTIYNSTDLSFLDNNLDIVGIQSFGTDGSNDRLVTAGSTLDLSQTAVSGFAVVSTNGLGTTFI